MPIGFAHRGGRAHGPENTIESFRRAIEKGATGLETDAWVTREGVAVLEHTGLVRRRFVPWPISRTAVGELPGTIPTLASLYEELGTGFELSVDVKVGIAGLEAIAAAHEAGEGAVSRLWLCHWDLRRLRAWRISSAEVRLVNSAPRWTMRQGLAKRARHLAGIGADAINLKASDWTHDRVRAVHDNGILAFGWHAHTASALERLLGMEIDAVYCDDVDLMIAVIGSR